MRPTEPRDVVHHSLGEVALVAVVLDRSGALALGEAVDERQVAKLRRVVAERLVELVLAEGVAHVVLAADNMGDAHEGVVADHHKVVGRGAVGADDDEVVELLVVDRHVAEDKVVDGGLAGLRHLEADGEGCVALGGVGPVAPTGIILRGAALGDGGLAHRHELLRGAVALVGKAAVEEVMRQPDVLVAARGLDDHVFVVMDAQPFEPLDDGMHGLLGGALEVGVFDAEQEFAARVLGIEEVEERRPSAADVEIAGRAGGKTEADRHGGWLARRAQIGRRFKVRRCYHWPLGASTRRQVAQWPVSQLSARLRRGRKGRRFMKPQ